MRLVCKQLRAAIDVSVSSLDIDLDDSDDPDEVLQRLARTSLRPSKLYLRKYSDIQEQRLPQLSSLTLTLTRASRAAAASLLLKGLEHITSLKSLDLSRSRGMLASSPDPADPAAAIGSYFRFGRDSLPLSATLPQLADLRLQSCPLQISSQLSRFLFQHLTALSVCHIHSRDLAALDCPQLQTLAVRQLLVDCEASLRACASGILQHCCAVWGLSTWEFQEVPSASALLEALAPWQPRSGKAIEELGLWHLSDVTREALEWLPVNINSLSFVPRSASFTWVLLAWAIARARYHHHQLYDKLGEAVQQGLQGSHLMPRLQQASSAAPPHPSSSSSSSVAATHSRSGHGTRSTSPLAGLPLSLPAPPPSPASPLPSTPLARGPPQPSPLPTPLAQLSRTCLVQLLWAFASHEHCQAALLRAAAPVLSARILQGQLSSRRVACVAWAYARLQQLEPRLVSAILRHSMAHAEQYELRYWARLAWAFSTLGLASEEAYHQRLARLMQERQQQLQRPTPAAGAVAAAQRPSRLQQRGRGHTAAPAARPGAGQGPRVGLECADEQDWMVRSRAQSQLLP
ncbi:hypothetical protein QJQ45_007488 [Haematococcus lacustris]|nr:hypothetical protein QJQ45_007488 [Haematococcus lacustris]